MSGSQRFTRSSFGLKVGVSLLLAGLAQGLLFGVAAGAVLGVFAGTWVVGVLVVRPGLLRDRRALFAILVALGLATAMVERPGLVAGALFALALTVAVLSARVGQGEPAWRWGQRLIVHGAVSLIGPFLDAARVLRSGRRTRHRRGSLSGLAKMLVLPVAGGLVFLLLFARANPLIADALDRIRLPTLSLESVFRLWFWLFVMGVVGATLRPRWRRRLLALPTLGRRALPGVSPASVTLSLLVFNALFALQNGLDIAFLWSGAPLPHDMTLADYAHRGAYPLIATALLAGLFVLVALRPGSETARKPLVRGLVVLWVAQNMVLVASSILRTADYIEAYALTRFRIVALVWMVMVGIGLLLILWRMLRDKDGHWLIDANVKLVLVVLAGLSMIDTGVIAAAWNVRHAREVDGTGALLDLGYLNTIGEPALVSLVELEQATADPALKDRVAAARRDVLDRVDRDNWSWRGWTWRRARRLARVEALATREPLIVPLPGERLWDGRLAPPRRPEPAPEAVPVQAPVDTLTPLTSAPGV